MSERWLTCDDLIALTGWSVRSIQAKTAKGSLRSRLTEQRGRNGRFVRLYLLASLPARFQMTYLAEEASRPSRNRLPNLQLSDRQLVLFDSVSASSREASVRGVQDDIAKKLRVIEPLIEYLTLPSKRAKTAWRDWNGEMVRNSDDLAERLAKRAGIDRAAVWRWYQRFRRDGVGGLARRSRKDKGQSGWFVDHPRAAHLTAWLLYRSHQSFRSCFDAITREASALGLLPDDLPSYETVRVWCKSTPLPVLEKMSQQWAHSLPKSTSALQLHRSPSQRVRISQDQPGKRRVVAV